MRCAVLLNVGEGMVMDMNRPQMYMAGIVILLLGLQLRAIDSVVLTEQATQFLAENMENMETASTAPTMFAARVPIMKKVVTPPRWLGWSLVSIGGVMVLHSLVVRRG
jgi:hypothetical protein